MAPLPAACKRCRFLHVERVGVGGVVDATCREGTPSLGDNGRAAWPAVQLGDWCGQYEALRVDDVFRGHKLPREPTVADLHRSSPEKP